MVPVYRFQHGPRGGVQGEIHLLGQVPFTIQLCPGKVSALQPETELHVIVSAVPEGHPPFPSLSPLQEAQIRIGSEDSKGGPQ